MDLAATQIARIRARYQEIRAYLAEAGEHVDAAIKARMLREQAALLLRLGEATAALERLEQARALVEGYGERLLHFLKSQVRLEPLTVKWQGPEAAAKLGIDLKTDPAFKQQVQEALRGHVAALIEQARAFVVQVVEAIRRLDNDPERKVVLLVDSVEPVRGVGVEAQQVGASLVDVFDAHAATLGLPQLHVLYTLPPFLASRSGVGGHAVIQWPNIAVRNRSGQPTAAGLARMRAVIERRYPHWEAVITSADLDDLALASGGNLRDFFRLLREAIVSAMIAAENRGQPSTLDRATVEQAKSQLRSEMLPIPGESGHRLLRIHASKRVDLESVADAAHLPPPLDPSLVLNYGDGEPWYDIHSLLLDEVAKYVSALAIVPSGSA